MSSQRIVNDLPGCKRIQAGRIEFARYPCNMDPRSLPSRGPVKLLLVDDDGRNIFKALKYMEICDNIRVTTADNGANAVHEFVRTDYDIIVTDAKLPIMDDCQFAAKVPSGFSAPKSSLLLFR